MPIKEYKTEEENILLKKRVKELEAMVFIKNNLLKGQKVRNTKLEHKLEDRVFCENTNCIYLKKTRCTKNKITIGRFRRCTEYNYR